MLFRVRDDLFNPVSIVHDAEVEAPVFGNPRLPNIVELVVLLGMQ
jgi:hypothetical protein